MNELISSIYNYCDRWCERCSFTDKCMVFQKEVERNIKHILNDEDPNDPDVFINDVAEPLTEALQMLSEEMNKEGIKLTEDDTPAPLETKDISHPLIDLAKAFFNGVRNCFSASSEEDENIQDQIQVLYWYAPQILVKIKMVLFEKEKLADQTDEFLLEIGEEQKNVNARIAYVGMDKSLTSLQSLYDRTEDEIKDKLLTLLATIKKLQENFVGEFPEVLTYKRPYFD